MSDGKSFLKANPAPLGLIAFGMTTVLLNMHNASPSSFGPIPMVLGMGIFYGGLAQVFAGIMEFMQGKTFGTVAFTSYGLFWLSLSAIWLIPIMYGVPGVNDAGLCAYLFMWGVFTMFMFLGTLRTNRVLQFVFFSLFILFYMLAIGHGLKSLGGEHVADGANLLKAAGVEGIICGFSALYLGLAEVINEANDRTALPIFPVKK